jgi:hypothetical protein
MMMAQRGEKEFKDDNINIFLEIVNIKLFNYEYYLILLNSS